jgi:hypothetical protein
MVCLRETEAGVVFVQTAKGTRCAGSYENKMENSPQGIRNSMVRQVRILVDRLQGVGVMVVNWAFILSWDCFILFLGLSMMIFPVAAFAGEMNERQWKARGWKPPKK